MDRTCIRWRLCDHGLPGSVPYHQRGLVDDVYRWYLDGDDGDGHWLNERYELCFPNRSFDALGSGHVLKPDFCADACDGTDRGTHRRDGHWQAWYCDFELGNSCCKPSQPSDRLCDPIPSQ